MADLINNQKGKTAGGDLRLGATPNPPDALPSVEAPTPVELPAKQAAPTPIAVPPPEVPQTSKVSSSPPSIVAPPERKPVMAVHLDKTEDAQVAAELEAANDPLPGDAYVAPLPPPAPWEPAVSFARGDATQYERPVDMTVDQAARAYLQPNADKAVAAQQTQQAISEAAIKALGPDDFIPYMINTPDLSGLIADSAQQRQSIFSQYLSENASNDRYTAALASQVEADRQAKNSSTSDGLDWVRTIIGQRDGVRKYNAPVQFNQQTQSYDTNLLGAVLYPLGVIQNTVIGAALDGRQLLRQLGNVVPPQHREFADRFIRRTALLRQVGIARWVLNGNKYDDGKSNIIEAIRGAQYSFSDDAGEGVGIGVQAGAFKTPKLPFVGEVAVNPSKLLGFAGDVFLGVKVDKAVVPIFKRLGIGPRQVQRAATATPPPSPPSRPSLPPSPQRRALPPGRSAIPQPAGSTPRQLPPARQQVVVLPPPRRAYAPQLRLPATPERKLLMPSRVTEARLPLNATPKEKLSLLKPLTAKPVFTKETAQKLVDELDDIFKENADVLKKYDFQAAPLSDKIDAVNTFLDDALDAKPERIIKELANPKNPVINIVKEQLSQTEWWGTPSGIRFATHIDDIFTAFPQKAEAVFESAGVNVEQLRQVVDDVVPTADTLEAIGAAQRSLPKGDEVIDAVSESAIAQRVQDAARKSQKDAINVQRETPDVGRNALDDDLIDELPAASVPQVELPLTALKGVKAYHGTRVQNLDIATIDPIVGSARNELGSGVYTYGSKSSASMPAKADAALNLPNVLGREFGDGVIHEVELNGNVLDGKAQLPQLKQLAEEVASPELRQALIASGDNSVVGILDTVGANSTEEAALQFQQRFTQALRENGVQHIKAGKITSTIDTGGVITKGVTSVKGASVDVSSEAMLRNRLKMERDAAEQTGSQFLKSTVADSAVRVESQALDGATQAVEAAELKTYDAVKRSGLLDDVTPVAKEPTVGVTPAERVSEVASRYVDSAKRSSDEYIQRLTEGKIPAKRGEEFSGLVRDILDGYVDDPKLISLLEGKYAKLYDSVADKIFNESYATLLPASVKPVATALDNLLAEIATHPPDKVPPLLQSKLDELLDQIDDEAFDRKFAEAAKQDPPHKNTDNPSSPCSI